MQTEIIRIGGMTCVNCQNRIEKKLKSLSGVQDAAVDYADGVANVTYDETAIEAKAITGAIEGLGYTVTKGATVPYIIGVLAIILALAFLLHAFSTSKIAASFPLAEEGMGYGMLLVIGLLTSVHCIAMCGGINLSQSLTGTLRPGILYNGGRLISYTAFGAAVGALGSVLTISDSFRTFLFLLAGLLMAIMGINMLGLFPWLRRFTQVFLKNKFAESGLYQFFTKKNNRGPLVIGFLNGFMPCGPLQAMQIYALSTANPVKGGVSMFLFCAGTIPLMFALGAAGGILSGGKGGAFSRRAMQAGAVLVAAMGVVMFANGWSGAEISFPLKRPLRAAVESQPGSDQQKSFSAVEDTPSVQIINSTLQTSRYPAITVQQGIPVRWIINAPPGSITGCNNRLRIREYGIQHSFKYGDNVIEFMPVKAGKFQYSCWMNMIRSTITVLAPGEEKPDIAPKPAGVAIPSDDVAVAKMDDLKNYQRVEINLTDSGFKPAIVVLQKRFPVVWTINIDSLNPGNSRILFPAYYAQIETEQGFNSLRLSPSEDFDFSTADNKFYGYVKTVENIENIDIEAIKAEVRKHQTLIYPAAYFEE